MHIFVFAFNNFKISPFHLNLNSSHLIVIQFSLRYIIVTRLKKTKKKTTQTNCLHWNCLVQKKQKKTLYSWIPFGANNQREFWKSFKNQYQIPSNMIRLCLIDCDMFAHTRHFSEHFKQNCMNKTTLLCY